MIFGWIERDLGADGCRALDQMVANGMRTWLADAAKIHGEEAARARRGGGTTVQLNDPKTHSLQSCAAAAMNGSGALGLPAST